jgi:hypothetical protein
MKKLNFITFLTCLIIFGSFFVPWVAGSGSIVKPLDDGTSFFQKHEPTGLFHFFVKTARGTVDTATSIITTIDLERELKGYEIPIAEETTALRPRIYLIYLLPLVALFTFFNVLKKNQSFLGRTANFLIVAGIASFLYIRIGILNREGLFLKIEMLYGFYITYYAYFVLSLFSFLRIFSRQSGKTAKKRKKG